MKTFLVLLKDKNTAAFNENLLQEHIHYLKKLTKTRKLLLCGPFVDDSGAMLVLLENSCKDIEVLVQEDPFIRANYYRNYSIHEFYKADASNDYLINHDQTNSKLK